MQGEQAIVAINYKMNSSDQVDFDLDELDPLQDNQYYQEQLNDSRPTNRPLRPRALKDRKCKNIYLQKISSLGGQDQHFKIDEEAERQLVKQQCTTKDEKLRRNRQSARKSRKRKNIYMQMLEGKVKDMQIEIENLKAIISAKDDLIKFLAPEGTDIQNKAYSFHLMRRRILDKLYKTVEAGSTELEITETLKCNRLSIMGGQRVDCIQFYFAQILDIIVPDLHKFILFSLCKKQDLFNDSFVKNGTLQPNSWSANLIKQCSLTLHQRHFIAELSGKIDVLRLELDGAVHRFSDAKNDLVRISRRLGESIMVLESNLSSQQVSKMILGVDKNRYRRELTSENMWDYIKTMASQHDH